MLQGSQVQVYLVRMFLHLACLIIILTKPIWQVWDLLHGLNNSPRQGLDTDMEGMELTACLKCTSSHNSPMEISISKECLPREWVQEHTLLGKHIHLVGPMEDCRQVLLAEGKTEDITIPAIPMLPCDHHTMDNHVRPAVLDTHCKNTVHSLF